MISATTKTLAAPSLSGRLTLLVLGEGVVANHPLPDAGEVLVGRDAQADIRIDHPSISRRHLVLHLGAVITFEDLGSSNGVRVRGAAVPAHRAHALALNEAIDVGPFMLMIQRRAPAPHVRRVWEHDYFEGRLAEECLRAERATGTFVVARFHADDDDATAALSEVLAKELRALDVIGRYGPHDFETLFIDTRVSDSQLPVERIVVELERRQVPFRLGVAAYPRDGRSPDALLAAAGRMHLPRARVEEGPAPAAPLVLVKSGAMERLKTLVSRVAQGTLGVLILGETGVGKEVLAESVHRLSPRVGKPFLRLNCAALSESLLESELFGHERGAFTGAVQGKVGLLETAEGGTIFLDEVGELPMATQVKLLRVIEERQVLRVGALKPRPIDVRFVAATNRDLEAEITRGNFRQDLFFRLNGVIINIPPLRERREEIPALVEGFMAPATREAGRAQAPRIHPAVFSVLERYHWPGNIRELRNVIQRAVLLAGDEITVEQLPMLKVAATFDTDRPASSATPSATNDATREHRRLPKVSAEASSGTPRNRLDSEMEAVERRHIAEVLDQCGGNQTRAAAELGISRRTLVNRLSAYDLPRPRKR